LLTERNGLSGTLASELKELTDLQFLLLEDGVISGEIPSELGLLSQLEVIDMNFNFLRGSLPDSLFGLAQLRQLDLNDNTITGTISSEFGRLSRLEFLQLQKNMFTGTIPSELGELQQLGKDIIRDVLLRARIYCSPLILSRHCCVTRAPTAIATLHDNQLEGSMPAEICELRSGNILEELTTDCAPESQSQGSPPYVACDLTCCTSCF
jgi:hypothetical protein